MDAFKQQRLTNHLGYAGLLPFVITLLMHINQFTMLGSPLTFFITYSAIIASFLSGALWRSAFDKDATNEKLTLCVSNVLALLAWIGWLIMPISIPVTLGLLTTVYLSILWYEEIYLSTQIAHEYHQLRRRLTFIVVTCHLLLWIL